MRKSVSLPFAAGLALAAAFVTAPPAMAEMVKMAATLEASQEVPPNDSAAKGTADITFDTETRKLDWTIEYSGLTGDATGAHFHGPAAAGQNADVAVPIEDPKSGAKGSATLTEAQATDLMAGQYYVNIHTAAHAGGEIRGQVERAM
ncbi:CHRD domain-containing protein [Kumtagia ephedrae]|uniref:CHRD domain-containing protein n=1 Tax=Kumtagia ephedrae TaxID=2116701 RepID=A0A2P7SQV2_9HYPH|nr:CHRD domain-containing protein [Mesorhizobium ephedrae]PSJ64848.1 CHRD domain-containing protein [Mesorhizobium ephedrae]